MNNSKYISKANSSFETKLNLYLFSKCISNSIYEINITDFNNFEITDNLVNVYTTKYWNWKDENIKLNKIPNSFNTKLLSNLTIKELYSEMKKWKETNTLLIQELKENYIKNFESVFPKKDFLELISSNMCEYCGVTINEIEKLVIKEKLYNKQPFRGFVLEIDRLNSNKEYTKDNCVMSCYWCNNAKTDEYTKEEFEIIGNAISKIWKERLK